MYMFWTCTHLCRTSSCEEPKNALISKCVEGTEGCGSQSLYRVQRFPVPIFPDTSWVALLGPSKAFIKLSNVFRLHKAITRTALMTDCGTNARHLRKRTPYLKYLMKS